MEKWVQIEKVQKEVIRNEEIILIKPKSESLSKNSMSNHTENTYWTARNLIN